MEDSIFKNFKKEIPGLKKNVLLSAHTTFKIGGPAKYFLETSEKKEIITALRFCKKNHIPFFILGGGSNLLVSDEGFSGLVLKRQDKNIILKSALTIQADGGTVLSDLVDFSINKSLSGLEWAGGLPGTFGGAVRGNAGCFGSETKDNIVQVEALDNNFKVKKLTNQECRFAYRTSIFKKKNWQILSATMQFAKADKGQLKEIADSHIQYRKDKQPLDFPNAGSIFKNCDLNLFSAKWQEKLNFVVKKDPFPVVPTAYLISEAGLKGVKIGNAQVSEKHPNFIINLGNAKAQDVLTLVDLIKDKIKKMYGVTLEMEVQYLGK